MKIFRRNSFGCCNVNKGLQTKDGRDDFWKLFCEILFLKHSAAQGPWTKKRDGTIVYHDIILLSSIRLLQRIDNTIFKREGKHHFLKKYT